MTKKHSSDRCPINGKRRYRDHEQAVDALRKIKSRDKRERTPVRVYEHLPCAGWHLTAQPEWGAEPGEV